MFREMRRFGQALPADEIVSILQRANTGILALSGDDGYPYAVPLNYVYTQNKLYFHCARSGHKLDAIQKNNRASFCVVDQDQVIPEEYATRYRSVIAFGNIRILEEEKEKRSAIQQLALKYAPQASSLDRQSAIQKDWERLCMLEMEIVHLTGKKSRV